MLIVTVFIWCFSALIVAVSKKKPKIIIVPAIFLITSVIVASLSNRVVVNQLSSLTGNNHITVTVVPGVNEKAKKLFTEVISNIYSFKGKSGSSPTGKKYLITVCDASAKCASIELGQDSRDPNMFWVGYKPYESSSFSLPLGFVKLEQNILEDS